MNIQQRLTSIFRDIFDDQKIEIKNTTTAQDIEDWDSLSHINLIAAVEREFQVRFALAELKNLKNVGEMISLIEKKAAQR